jgi:hypothetical protein
LITSAASARRGRRLGGKQVRALGSEPVVAAQPVLDDLFPVHRYQFVHPEPFQRGVQRPGTHPHPAAGDLPDVGDDPVAVLAAGGQRGEDQEGGLLHGPMCHTHFIYR